MIGRRRNTQSAFNGGLGRYSHLRYLRPRAGGCPEGLENCLKNCTDAACRTECGVNCQPSVGFGAGNASASGVGAVQLLPDWAMCPEGYVLNKKDRRICDEIKGVAGLGNWMQPRRW